MMTVIYQYAVYPWKNIIPIARPVNDVNDNQRLKLESYFVNTVMI